MVFRTQLTPWRASTPRSSEGPKSPSIQAARNAAVPASALPRLITISAARTLPKPLIGGCRLNQFGDRVVVGAADRRSARRRIFFCVGQSGFWSIKAAISAKRVVGRAARIIEPAHHLQRQRILALAGLGVGLAQIAAARAGERRRNRAVGCAAVGGVVGACGRAERGEAEQQGKTQPIDRKQSRLLPVENGEHHSFTGFIARGKLIL